MKKKNKAPMKNGITKMSIGIEKHFDKKNIPFLYPTLLTLLINIISIILIVFAYKKLPPQVPLYYGLTRGERQLVQPLVLILPISISSLFVALNSIFAYFTKSVFSKKILVVSGFFISVLSLITVIRIITTIGF